MMFLVRALTSSPLNVMLVAAPASWVLHGVAPESSWVFLTAAASLVPLAGLIGLGTEQLAARSGPAMGADPEARVRAGRAAPPRR